MNRRGFISGLITAPFVIRESGVLMPVKKFVEKPYIGWDIGGESQTFVATYQGNTLLDIREITKEAVRQWKNEHYLKWEQTYLRTAHETDT